MPTDEYLGERHVYQPHRAGLPRLRPYFRELWRRRGFATELARTQMRAANTDTVFGQAWLVINPLLLAGVYYLLVSVVSGSSQGPTFFARLTSGLFIYYFITGAMLSGTTAVTAGGRLVLNTPFPKMLLTISATYLAFRRYLPTILVYGVIAVWAKLPFGPHLLWMIPILVMSAAFGLGLANLFATVQVYFRDTASFLPYFVRLWLYVSPVLWLPERILTGHHSWRGVVAQINPLFGIIGAQAEVLIEGRNPSATLILEGAAWSLVVLVVGSLLFMSREREFAVRL